MVLVIIGICRGHRCALDRRRGQRPGGRARGHFACSTLLELLREEAVMQNRDYGILFAESGYRFYIYDQAALVWFEPTDDRFLAARELEGLTLDLSLEDRDIALSVDFDDEMLAEPEPQVVLLASGEMTPFEAAIFRDFGGAQYRLSAELNGANCKSPRRPGMASSVLRARFHIARGDGRARDRCARDDGRQYAAQPVCPYGRLSSRRRRSPAGSDPTC